MQHFQWLSFGFSNFMISEIMWFKKLICACVNTQWRIDRLCTTDTEKVLTLCDVIEVISYYSITSLLYRYIEPFQICLVSYWQVCITFGRSFDVDCQDSMSQYIQHTETNSVIQIMINSKISNTIQLTTIICFWKPNP